MVSDTKWEKSNHGRKIQIGTTVLCLLHLAWQQRPPIQTRLDEGINSVRYFDSSRLPVRRSLLEHWILCRFSSNTMTPFFISRVFEEHASARPEASLEEDDGSFPSASTSREMSLEDFSDFVLAWENRGSALGINYFFSVFDTRHTGSINQVRQSCFASSILLCEWICHWGNFKLIDAWVSRQVRVTKNKLNLRPSLVLSWWRTRFWPVVLIQSLF